MSDIILKKFEGEEIRSVKINGLNWYVAKDVCRVLELQNSKQAVKVLEDDQRDEVQIMDPIGRLQKTNVINKSGALTLALRSRKPEAKKFQRWLTDDVVPEIEATGSYNGKTIDFSKVDMSASNDVAKMLIQAGSKIMELNEQVEAMTPLYQFGTELKSTDNLFTVTEVAKELGASAQCLNGFLHDKKIVYKHRGCWVPYASYDSSGFFKKVNTTIVKTDSGESFQKHSLKITAKGQEFIHKLWREHKEKLLSSKPLELDLKTA